MTQSVCAITITFNPELELLERQLGALRGQCEVVLVDNGSGGGVLEGIERLSRRYGARLLSLGANLGIAAAQNRGVAWVEGERPDCRYLLFLDHDSVPGDGFVAGLVEEFLRIQRSGAVIGAVGPGIREARSGAWHGFHLMRGGRYLRVRPDEMGEDAVACVTINSAGTLCPLSVWRRVGPFEERLFIDHVETEWCFRAARAGFQLFGTRRVVLEHRMGDAVLRLRLPFKEVRLPYRNPSRHYYLMRNSVELLRRDYVPLPWKFYCVLKIGVTFLVFGVMSEERALQRRGIVLGIRHGLAGRLGKLEDLPQATSGR